MKVHEYHEGQRGAPKYKGALIGVELEVEGERLFDDPATKAFAAVHDGSLRGGMEYVLKKPLDHAVALNACKALFKEMDAREARTNYSFRTSTHVHLNVLDMETSQVMNLIYLYMLVEPMMMNCVAEHRRGNRFCLRFFDSEALSVKFADIIRDFHRIYHLSQDEYKYSALNLATLAKYGTVEFRALEGTRDEAKLESWFKTITNLRSVALEFENLRQIHEAFIQDPEALIDRVFHEGLVEQAKADGWKQSVEESYSLSYHMVLVSEGVM